MPVCVITGGAGDLAQTIAVHLRDLGWDVRTPSRHEMDVTSAAAVAAYFVTAPAVDLLIHNAAVTGDRLLARQSSTERDAVIDVALRGAFLTSRAVLPSMERRRAGHIVLIGSWVGQHGNAGQSAYAAAKAGLIGFGKALAQEVGPANIRVNVLLPGWLATKMTAVVDDETRDAAQRAHVLGHLSTMADAARAVSFLHAMEHLSGQVINIDSRVGA
jgi:NAD(P)-dependent dehydrogenase (short-subunit alcohol dehydrogenase family)